MALTNSRESANAHIMNSIISIDFFIYYAKLYYFQAIAAPHETQALNYAGCLLRARCTRADMVSHSLAPTACRRSTRNGHLIEKHFYFADNQQRRLQNQTLTNQLNRPISSKINDYDGLT